MKTYSQDEIDALFGEAVSAREAGDLERAISCLQELVEKKPDSATGWAVLGDAYDDFGQPTLAIDAFKRATTLSPRSHLASTMLAFKFFQAGQMKEGLDEIRRYLAIRNDQAFDEFIRECFERVIAEGEVAEDEREVVTELVELAIEYRSGVFTEMIPRVERLVGD